MTNVSGGKEHSDLGVTFLIVTICEFYIFFFSKRKGKFMSFKSPTGPQRQTGLKATATLVWFRNRKTVRAGIGEHGEMKLKKQATDRSRQFLS